LGGRLIRDLPDQVRSGAKEHGRKGTNEDQKGFRSKVPARLGGGGRRFERPAGPRMQIQGKSLRTIWQTRGAGYWAWLGSQRERRSYKLKKGVKKKGRPRIPFERLGSYAYLKWRREVNSLCGQREGGKGRKQDDDTQPSVGGGRLF